MRKRAHGDESHDKAVCACSVSGCHVPLIFFYHYLQGEWFWIPHPELAYVPAVLVSENKDKLKLKSEDGQVCVASTLLWSHWPGLKPVWLFVVFVDERSPHQNDCPAVVPLAL